MSTGSSQAKHPAPTCDSPRLSWCPVPPPHLGSSSPASPKAQTDLDTGIAGLPWLTQAMPRSSSCFPEDCAGGKEGRENVERMGLLGAKWGSPQEGETRASDSSSVKW